MASPTGRQLPYPSENLGRGVGIVVENYNLVPRLQQGKGSMTPDKTRSPGKQNFHEGLNFIDCLEQLNAGWTG